MVSVKMHLHSLSDYVLETTKNINCGSTLISLIPSLLFLWNLHGLAHTFLKSTNERSHGFTTDVNRFGPYCLKNILSLILLWGGVQCWSDGLLRFLNTYTAGFVMMINGSLRSNHQLSQSAMDTLGYMLKLSVCYSVAIFVRLCDKRIKNSCFANTRIRRFRRPRLNNWYRVVPRRTQINELGEEGVTLQIRNWFPELQRAEIRKPIKLRNTQSCHLLTNITPILKSKIDRRRKSI